MKYLKKKRNLEKYKLCLFFNSKNIVLNTNKTIIILQITYIRLYIFICFWCLFINIICIYLIVLYYLKCIYQKYIFFFFLNVILSWILKYTLNELKKFKNKSQGKHLGVSIGLRLVLFRSSSHVRSLFLWVRTYLLCFTYTNTGDHSFLWYTRSQWL